MARTSNEFGGGEIVPAIEAITGIQAPVMADFVAVPFGTVNHEHGERRQIQNLQNNLKSSSGIERIPFNGIDELDTEQGPNGETVHALNTGDSRIRFVGSGWTTEVSSSGTAIRGSLQNDFVEITFFGTNINLLSTLDGSANVRLTVDGGTEGTTNIIEPSSASTVLNGQNVTPNTVVPLLSTPLSAGIHTIKLRLNNAGSSTFWRMSGCEVINENAAITQQSGADFDGRVEALGGTSFPIKPLNTTISAVNSRNGASEAFAGTTGARVLNYITSGGQFKQSFDVADEVLVTVAGQQEYTIEIQNGGSTSVTLPANVSSFILSAFAGGGGGGGSGGATKSFGTAGAGGGGGSKSGATFTRSTSTQAETLALVVSGTAAGSFNLLSGFGTAGGVTTVTTGGTAIATTTGGSGGESGGVLSAAAGGAGGAVGVSQTFTGWTIGSQVDAGGNGGGNGGGQNGTSGAGGNVGGFGITPLTGIEGQGGAGQGTSTSTGTFGNPGQTPGGGGAGISTNTSPGVGNSGGTGAAGRVYLTISATAGLTNTSFGVAAGEFTSGAIVGGVLGSPTAKFGNVAFDLNRLNQEVIRRINVREFGANSAFATASNAVGQGFTLDDGTTTLVGYRSGSTNAGDLTFNVGALGKSYISFNRTGATDGRKSLIITFVGTGLDTEWNYSGGTGAVYGNIEVQVDGLSIGNLTPIAANAATNTIVVRPIVSGLAYGTHTVSFSSPNNSSGFDNAFGIADFILYGPKKPEISTLDVGSLELSDYNIMADFVGTTGSTTPNVNRLRIGKGTLRKMSTREFRYTNEAVTGPAIDGGAISGFQINMQNGNVPFFYTFYGTGCEFRFGSSVAKTYNFFIDQPTGSGNTATPLSLTQDNFFSNGSGGTFVIADNATGSFNGATVPVVSNGQVTITGANDDNLGFRVTGLTLGVHTIAAMSRTSSTAFRPRCVDVITPIHINDDSLKVGSEGLNNLTIDPVVEEDEQVALNLGEAKAWINYDPVNDRVLSSFNVSAVIESTSNASQAQIYFDKPFKDANYIAIATGGATSPGGIGEVVINTSFKEANYVRIQTESSAGTLGYFAAFFGELIDE